MSGVERVHARPGRAQRGAAEEGRGIGVDRRAVERGDAAVGGAVVAEVFVAEHHAGVGAGADRHGRVDAGALDVDAVAVAVGVFDHAR